MSDVSYKLIDIAGEQVAAEQIGAYTYKLLENPVFSCKLNYGTTIQAMPDSDGKLKMTKVVRASPFVTRQFLLSTDLDSSGFKEAVGKSILQLGGTWEAAFGGLVFIHLPRNIEINLDALLKDSGIGFLEVADNTQTGV